MERGGHGGQWSEAEEGQAPSIAPRRDADQALRAAPAASRVAEDAAEDRVDMLQVIAEVEEGLQLGLRNRLRHLPVFLQQDRKSPLPSQTFMALRWTVR